ncbi:energy-dependent translational throttle protein EttA [Micavibrio aeruginosavorus]|uniref:Energy-dependent translational throttle protein EttA n=1 Tax=Micavibrio aeruginosavorus (strain ARL-13) TaxID=856793 RepID=G2KP38_MICAA|nr:energy-dependent translational throttle protein EttA [Micavibrio aeruginosavorus]AEP08546.1 ABC transporter family protein [Micavibrio aeruginosavorus ARL-13]
MASYQYVYVMNGLSKTWPNGKKVLENITLSFFPGAKIGVLGPNGAGKSTLLKLMAGVDKDFTGEAWAAEGARVGYLAQEPQLDPTKNVVENITEALKDVKNMVDRFNAIGVEMAEPDADYDSLMAEMGELQEKIDAVDGWELDRTIEIAMDALRCPPADADVTKLSGGERRRVALCRLLLEKPDLLLLDEPTNHLDAESVAWLQRFLTDYKGTVVMVTHDRYFLDNVTGWILEVDRGRGIPYEGNYSAYLNAKRKRMELESKQEDERQKTLSRELEWIQQSPEGRRKKSKARVAAYEDLLAQSQKSDQRNAQIVIPTPPRLGNVVIEAEGLRKGFGDRLLIENLSFKLPPGGIVGVIGPNGAGKSTLFRMITGQEQPDEGSFRVGETVKLGYVDQSRDALDGDKNVWEEISDGMDILKLGKIEMPSRAYVSAFNFRGPDQQKKVGSLSGGERNRVHLAKMLKSGANVLLLDEPTNDLDTETLAALEEALEQFAGCAVVISHDRAFLDRLATHILAFEGDSQVTWFEGNYEDYEKDYKRRLGRDADQPHRIKYKPLRRAG